MLRKKPPCMAVAMYRCTGIIRVCVHVGALLLLRVGRVLLVAACASLVASLLLFSLFGDVS